MLTQYAKATFARKFWLGIPMWLLGRGVPPPARFLGAAFFLQVCNDIPLPAVVCARQTRSMQGGRRPLKQGQATVMATIEP